MVHCDVTKDPPIEQGYDTLYDVVICSLVLEGARVHQRSTNPIFICLSSLVKPGGSLLLYGVENQVGYYTIGTKNYPNAYVTNEYAVDVFKNCGFRNVVISTLDVEDRVFRFIKGIKV